MHFSVSIRFFEQGHDCKVNLGFREDFPRALCTSASRLGVSLIWGLDKINLGLFFPLILLFLMLFRVFSAVLCCI